MTRHCSHQVTIGVPVPVLHRFVPPPSVELDNLAVVRRVAVNEPDAGVTALLTVGRWETVRALHSDQIAVLERRAGPGRKVMEDRQEVSASLQSRQWT